MDMLSDLIDESMELNGHAETQAQVRYEEAQATGSNGRLGPGDIGPKPVKADLKKKIDDNAIWDAEEVPEENLTWDDEGDERPEPEYTVAYKQRVGSEDVFLGINGRDPGSHCCEDLSIKVRSDPQCAATQVGRTKRGGGMAD